MEKILFYRRFLLSVLLFLLVTHPSSGNSQNAVPITLNKANITLAEVFKSIKKQTGLSVFYSNRLLDDKEIVSVKFQNTSLQEVLNTILKDKNLGYVLRDQLIVIEKLESVAPKKAPAQLGPPKKVKGTVTDEKGQTLPGVSVKIKGTTVGTQTDINGNYSLNIDDAENVIIVFSFVGSKKQELALKNYKPLNNGAYVVNVVMENQSSLEEVAVVAYGTQKKTTLVSSVTSIDPKELKGPTSNLTTMLAGKIAGIIAYQRSGEPGQDNASFFIRNVGSTVNSGPLILIDGVESTSTDLARLQPDDIAGFSELKDATATSLYGARGAKGVLLITTKIGESGKTKFNFRVENSTSANTRNIELANNISYMTLANEAVLTRNPLSGLPYSQNKIDHTANGDNPFLYPSNNWIQQLIKDKTNNQRINLNASGGSERAKYYIAGTYNIDNGNLKENSLNGFSNNIKLISYSLLSNTTLNLTKTTEALISLKGQFDDYNGPVGGGSQVYTNALWSNPVAFPAVYPSSYLPYAKHPLFGNAVVGGALYTNPYAQSLSGFQTQNTSTLTAQFSLKQNMNAITPGLSARMMAYVARYAQFGVTRSVSPFYYSSNVVDGVFTGLTPLNTGAAGSIGVTPTEYLSYAPSGTKVNSTAYGEAAINYSRVFKEKHAIGALLVGTIKDYLTGNASDLQSSLPARNEGVSGRFTYGYDNRYLFEADFGYNGSERFAANHRFGFFPSIGGGWIVSNEKFFKPLLNIINQLKFRGTYGLVGNDQIGNSNDRFFYLSNVNLNGGATGSFGTNFTYSRPTVSTSRYANPDITWELHKTTNIGMDLTLFHDLTLNVDAYRKYISNMLVGGSITTNIPSTMGLQADLSSNSGSGYSEGLEATLIYSKTFDNSLWIQTRGTLTYSRSKVISTIEPNYTGNNINLSQVGNSFSQIYGLVAERLFTDQQEVNNSPTQFGNVMAGDIKYRDINKDGKITTADMVPIGFPTTPEMIYGFSFSVGYKNFDFSAAFQGSARSSFLIDTRYTTPFINAPVINASPYYLQSGNQAGLLQVIADSHWSEDNRNSYAFWPRLDNTLNQNNTQSSSWWLENGAFIRLKTAEIGYNVPVSLLKRMGIGNGRIYVNGTNLFTRSVFKLWDPEMGASGLGYPIQKVFNVGLSMGF